MRRDAQRRPGGHGQRPARPGGRLRSDTAWGVATIIARLSLAAGFLSAVADRLGLWGPSGHASVAWGSFSAFLDYTHQLAPYLSGWMLQATAWTVTVVELTLGLALLLGVALRWVAGASAGLLLIFAASMGAFDHIEAPLIASVPSACSAALLLALCPAPSFPLSLDRWRERRTSQRA